MWRLPPVTLQWGWMAIAVIFLGASIAVIASEFRVAAWLLGQRVQWPEAFRVTILSSAANLLPLPGGIAVRTDALRKKGLRWQAALGSNAIVGLGWLGVALLLAGGLLYGEAREFVVAVFLLAGVVVIAGMGVGLVKFDRNVGGSALLILSVEAIYVIVAALRLFALLMGLDIAVSYGQAVTLIVASALAAGIGFFPGGLGIRELLAGALSPLVGLAPEVGAFVSVVDRILSVTVRGSVALWLWGPRGAEAERS